MGAYQHSSGLSVVDWRVGEKEQRGVSSTTTLLAAGGAMDCRTALKAQAAASSDADAWPHTCMPLTAALLGEKWSGHVMRTVNNSATSCISS